MRICWGQADEGEAGLEAIMVIEVDVEELKLKLENVWIDDLIYGQVMLSYLPSIIHLYCDQL